MQSGLGDSRNISDPLIGEKKKDPFPHNGSFQMIIIVSESLSLGKKGFL